MSTTGIIIGSHPANVARHRAVPLGLAAVHGKRCSAHAA